MAYLQADLQHGGAKHGIADVGSDNRADEHNLGRVNGRLAFTRKHWTRNCIREYIRLLYNAGLCDSILHSSVVGLRSRELRACREVLQ